MSVVDGGLSGESRTTGFSCTNLVWINCNDRRDSTPADYSRQNQKSFFSQ